MQTHGIEIPNPTQKKNGANYKTPKKHIFFQFQFQYNYRYKIQFLHQNYAKSCELLMNNEDILIYSEIKSERARNRF